MFAGIGGEGRSQSQSLVRWEVGTETRSRTAWAKGFDGRATAGMEDAGGR